MAKQVILGSDLGRDALKVKCNVNFTELYDFIGTLTSLSTEDKTNLVNAINEHEEQINSFINIGYTDNAKPVNNIDFNNMKTQGKYITNYSIHTNGPVNYEQLFFVDVTGTSISLVQEAVSLNGLDKFYRVCNAGTWNPWRKIVTDKQPDWINATLVNGWTGALRYRKQLEKIEVRASTKAGTVGSFIVIGSLPSGYYPTGISVPFLARDITKGIPIPNCVIAANGEIKIDTSSVSTVDYVEFNFVFNL